MGQSSEAALSNQYVILIATGSFTLESGASRKFLRKSGLATSIVPDCSGFQYTQVGSTDVKDVADYSNGAIIVNTGNPSVVSLSVTGTSESNFHDYLDSWSILSGTNFLRAVRSMLATLCGTATVNMAGDQVDYADPGASGTDRVRHEEGTNDGDRTGTLL